MEVGEANRRRLGGARPTTAVSLNVRGTGNPACPRGLPTPLQRRSGILVFRLEVLFVALSIKNVEPERLARELAREQGTIVTRAVIAGLDDARVQRRLKLVERRQRVPARGGLSTRFAPDGPPQRLRLRHLPATGQIIERPHGLDVK